MYMYTHIRCIVVSTLHGSGLNPTFSGTCTASRPLLFQWKHIEGIVAGALRPAGAVSWWFLVMSDMHANLKDEM